MDVKSEPDEEDLPDLIDLDLIKTENIEADEDSVDTEIKLEKLQCTSCSQTFNCEYLLKVHQMLHDPNQYCFICKKKFVNNFDAHVVGKHFNQCNLCLKTFTEGKTLKRHMELHTGNLSYLKCNLCDKVFRQKGSLNVHIRASHNGLKPYTCTECENNISFTTSSGLKRHQNRFHDTIEYGRSNRVHECTYCYASLESYKAKKAHETKHRSNTCETCKETFNTTLDVRKHFALVHAMPDRVPCEECWMCFKKTYSLQKHIEAAHRGVMYSCQKCDLTYRNKSSLLKHNNKFHDPKNPYEVAKCTICSESFTKKYSLQKHIEAAHRGMKYSCQKCDLSYRHKRSLFKHNNKYHDPKNPYEIEKDYKCTICSETFTNLAQRKNHAAKHRRCEVCEKIFESVQLLEKHLREDHNDAKSCPHCHELFSKFELVNHIRIKHKERKCFHCPKVFHVYTDFHSHLLSHKIPIICETCGKNLEKYNIEKHMRNHYKGLVKTCRICKKLVTNLELHYNRVHTCSLCDLKQVFRSSIAMRVHYIRHHPNIRKCTFCQKNVLKSNFKQHMKGNHNIQQVYECDKCAKVFYRHHVFDAHREKYCKGGIECKHCLKTFKVGPIYNEHNCIKLPEQERLEESTVMKIADKKYQCKGCFKIIGKMRSIKNHFCGLSRPTNPGFYSSGKKNANKRKHCDKCGFSCLRNKAMVKHVLKYHSNEKEEKLLSGNEMTREDEAAADALFSEELDFKMKMKIEEMMQEDMDLGCLVDCIVKSEDSV